MQQKKCICCFKVNRMNLNKSLEKCAFTPHHLYVLLSNVMSVKAGFLLGGCEEVGSVC